MLVVEDDLYSYELIAEYLSGTGIRHHHVTNGKEAVNFMTDHRDVDLVVMDIQIPGMNGYEAARLIKTVRPDIFVIAQTAFAMEEDRKMAGQAGCDDFLSKPLDRNVFLTVLKKYLG